MNYIFNWIWVLFFVVTNPYAFDIIWSCQITSLILEVCLFFRTLCDRPHGLKFDETFFFEFNREQASELLWVHANSVFVHHSIFLGYGKVQFRFKVLDGLIFWMNEELQIGSMSILRLHNSVRQTDCLIFHWIFMGM